jgi:hypothetical protein
MNFLKSSARSITSSLGALSRTRIRYASTTPEFVRPPGLIKSWTKDERNAYNRWRYANNAAYRLSIIQANTLQRQSPAYREAASKRQKERYANDPDYRKAIADGRRRWWAKPENRKEGARQQRERYDKDPDHREKRKRKALARYYDPEHHEKMKRNARERYWKLKFGLATARAGREEGQDNPQTPDKSDGSEAKP